MQYGSVCPRSAAPVIQIVTMANHRYTHKSLEEEADLDLRVISYSELFNHQGDRPIATYVFTDFDRLAGFALDRAALLYRELRDQGSVVLNDPALALGRFGLLRALNRAGINMFDAYRVDALEKPARWPVFLRVEGDHGKPVSGLIDSEEQLDSALEKSVQDGVPRSLSVIVEYAAEPVRPGLFRKLSVFRVGDRLLGYTCVHDDNWLVKYGKPSIATPELYDEEYGFVSANPFAEALKPVFDLAGVDYGRADFGLVDGRPQIYEINTNPEIKLRPPPAKLQRRNESVELFRSNYLEAMRTIDRTQ
jgi:hypothetical protein